jgi:uncharacterized membrane protein (DUF485 family)
MTRKPAAPDSDLTAESGSSTDVAPLGRGAAKPAHERTADEDVDVADWQRIAALDEFKALLRAKARFIVPATIVFIVYYFALPLLVGYAPELMAKKVIGVVNVAYLFALSQFFVAWLLALLYVRAAQRFDAMASAVIERYKRSR